MLYSFLVPALPPSSVSKLPTCFDWMKLNYSFIIIIYSFIYLYDRAFEKCLSWTFDSNQSIQWRKSIDHLKISIWRWRWIQFMNKFIMEKKKRERMLDLTINQNRNSFSKHHRKYGCLWYSTTSKLSSFRCSRGESHEKSHFDVFRIEMYFPLLPSGAYT